MKIPQNELENVFKLLSALNDKLLSLGVVDDKTKPMCYISNIFPSYVWLTYHPVLSVGGSDSFYEGHFQKNVLYFDTVFKQLVWYNTTFENGVAQAGWHPLHSEIEEVIGAIL